MLECLRFLPHCWHLFGPWWKYSFFQMLKVLLHHLIFRNSFAIFVSIVRFSFNVFFEPQSCVSQSLVFYIAFCILLYRVFFPFSFFCHGVVSLFWFLFTSGVDCAVCFPCLLFLPSHIFSSVIRLIINIYHFLNRHVCDSLYKMDWSIGACIMFRNN